MRLLCCLKHVHTSCVYIIDIPACESVHMKKSTINHSVDLELFIDIGWRKKGHEMSGICRIKMETHIVHAGMGNHL